MPALDLSALQNAILTFTRTSHASQDKKIVTQLSTDLQEAIKAGVIQNFEFTYELSWKFIKRWLEKNYGSTQIDGVTRRELFRLAAETQLIDSVDEWMLYHQARNQTSHTYDETVASDVYKTALVFLAAAQQLLQRLQAKND
ncbi:MAG: HI0074 family nucleotidyltransferase substrate-binding subunit [Gammaproteobacteria bacterium]|nr:HI0074 family nucleotidyltransferase substrate-binding subunit [Gammaproteobacteria bacterium]